MSKDLLDDEFYEKKELASRDWWESKRNLFNKYLAGSIGCLFLITIVLFWNKEDVFASLIVCTVISLLYFTICNIGFSGVWVLEDVSKKIFNIKTKDEIRIIIFRCIIFILFSPNLLYLFFILI
jgi:hypothetical protein